MINIGTQLVFINGYKSFDNDTVYHFLVNDTDAKTVRLVSFCRVGAIWTPVLQALSSFEFEELVISSRVVVIPEQRYLPPWLGAIQDVDYKNLDLRVDRVNSNQEIAQSRFLAIAGLVDNAQTIIRSINPDKIINLHARSLTPNKKAKALRLWFYSYIIFGMNLYALLPAFQNIGHYDRVGVPRARLGRPAGTGTESGFNADQAMIEKIQKGFKKYGKNKTFVYAYRKTVQDVFGCKSKRRNNVVSFYHPDNLSFPSYEQFRYWISARKMEGDDPGLHILGDATFHTHYQGNKGSFSEHLSNAMQRVQMDAYTTDDHPRNMDGVVLDKIKVVRAICCLTGVLAGIGFSVGGENLLAYRMALFCMAIGKIRFCKLFGLEDDELDETLWFTEGLPLNLTIDRGPGTGLETVALKDWIAELAIAPSYRGQAKAKVESSHPRSRKNDGPPTHIVSHADTVKIVKREILLLIRDNDLSDASRNMTPQVRRNARVTTPNEYYRYLTSVGRSSASIVQFDDAVRTFLTKNEVDITTDGVIFKGRRYGSSALDATGIFNRSAKQKVRKETCYILEMCVRHIWVEYKGRLFELDAILPAQDSRDELYITLADLNDEFTLSKHAAAGFAAHSHAASVFHDEILARAVGGNASGKVVGGVRKKTMKSKSAQAEARRSLGAR